MAIFHLALFNWRVNLGIACGGGGGGGCQALDFLGDHILAFWTNCGPDMGLGLYLVTVKWSLEYLPAMHRSPGISSRHAEL